MNKSAINHAILGCAIGLAAPTHDAILEIEGSTQSKQMRVMSTRERSLWWQMAETVSGAGLGIGAGIAISRSRENLKKLLQKDGNDSSFLRIYREE